jgi:hypothetical protein
MVFDPVPNESSEGQGAGHHKPLKKLKKRKT